MRWKEVVCVGTRTCEKHTTASTSFIRIEIITMHLARLTHSMRNHMNGQMRLVKP